MILRRKRKRIGVSVGAGHEYRGLYYLSQSVTCISTASQDLEHQHLVEAGCGSTPCGEGAPRGVTRKIFNLSSQKNAREEDYSIARARRTSSTGFDSWKDGGPEAATWEDIATIKFQFPDFYLEDKVACTRELIVDANIDYNAREGRSTAEVRDSAKGKPASTKFTRISTNGTQSIVLCEPITGRTHQIRVHLKYSGHPIANDMLYISEQTVDRSVKGSSADRSARISDVSLTSDLDEVPNACRENSSEDFSIDPMCTNCPNLAPKGYDGDEEGLWLHCFRYTGPGWTYECPHPDWAKLI